MNLRFRNEAAAAAAPSSRAAAAAAAGAAAAGSGGSLEAAARQGGGHGGGRSGVEGPGLSVAQRGLYCLGAVVLRYAWARLGHLAAAAHWGDESAGAGWRRAAWVGMQRAESAYRLASLANWLAFLRSGRYRWAG